MKPAAIQRDQSLAEVISEMEDSLHKVKALGHAMMAIFESGTGPGGLASEDSDGGSIVAETMLAHFEVVMEAWHQAFELSRDMRGEGG